MNSSPAVFLISDDSDFSEVLSKLIAAVGLKFSRFASGGEFLTSYDDGCPGCVVVDLGTPHVEGIRLLAELSRRPLRPPVVGLVTQVDVTAVVQAARHGVAAVLQMQHTSSTELLDTIQAAIAQDARQRANLARGEEIRGRFDSLTSGEWLVLERLVQGDELAAIAEHLDVSRRTVENRRARLMNKLQVTTFVGLMRLLIEKGHFPPKS